MFDDLCDADLDWSRVDILLTDERWVPEDSERSNTRLLRERLLIDRAAEANYIPLYRDSEAPEAYERLIMDVIRGDQTLFMRGDEVEAAWAWTDPVIRGWKDLGDKPKPYDIGSTGPEDAAVLMHREGRKWLEVRA